MIILQGEEIMGNTRNPRHHLFNKIRDYYNDRDPGNIHQVLDRNQCNLMYSVIRKRVNVLGWNINDALTKPHADVVPVKSGGASYYSQS